MKTKHIVELVGVLGFLGLLVWYFTSKAGTTSTSNAVGSIKPVTAGQDTSLGAPSLNLAPSTAVPPDLSKPDVNGNSWVNGVDQSGNALGMVEIDGSGNVLVAASKGPATESLKGKAHF